VSQLIGEISEFKIPIFFVFLIGLLSDWKGCRKLLLFIPIVGGIVAGFGGNRQNFDWLN
jgi:hypothetical protein